MAEHDAEHDPRVTAGYRALDKENPPAALDTAILAASRRAVGARPTVAGARLRRWALPISIAAVIVLTMSLTLRVQLERSDLESAEPMPTVSAVPPVPQSRSADDKDAPRSAALESKGEVRATAKQNRPADVRAKAKPAAESPAALESPLSVRGAGEREQSALARKAMKTPPARTEAPPAAKRAPAPAAAAGGFVQAPPARPAASAESTATAPLGATAVPGASRPDETTGRARQMPAEADANAGRAASRMALEDRVQPLAEQAGKADADLSPRDWLERIARLRRDGRTQEADESLAAFRRRYPDYEIPKELRDAVLGEAAR
jgi:Meckel syndrome type 1 protein